MKKRMKKLMTLFCAAALVITGFTGCGSSEEVNAKAADSVVAEASEEMTETTEGEAASGVMSNEEIIKQAAGEGKVGNWGLGNEYEVQALLAKYDQDISFLSQAFDMDGFDDDSITLASAMTYNELGLVVNDYDGGYSYGNTVGTIDMNDEGVAMLEDNIFCTKEFANENPNTVKAFIYASLKGWEYACQNPEEAAEIVFQNGSSVSPDHQAYMAAEVKKVVETNTSGEAVTDYGKMDENAMQQTLDLAKQYISLDDSASAERLQELTLDDIRDTSFWEEAAASEDGQFDVEKSDVSIQLKWLPQAQFMGYFVAKDKGFYEEAGLNVNIVSGGGDIGETTAVNNGSVDFGVTWVSNLIAANAGGMELVEISQIYQSSGLVLVYKLENFKN